MSYDNSIGLEDDINSMLSNITNEKKKSKREAQKNADKLLKGKFYKEDFDQINDIMLDINCNSCNSKNQIIALNEKHNIFHWVKVLENAQTIALVDSAPANLVEQLNISCKKIVLRKPGHPIPTFRNKWIIKEV